MTCFGAALRGASSDVRARSCGGFPAAARSHRWGLVACHSWHSFGRRCLFASASVGEDVLISTLPRGGERRLSCPATVSAVTGQRDLCPVCMVVWLARDPYAGRGNDLRVVALVGHASVVIERRWRVTRCGFRLGGVYGSCAQGWSHRSWASARERWSGHVHRTRQFERGLRIASIRSGCISSLCCAGLS